MADYATGRVRAGVRRSTRLAPKVYEGSKYLYPSQGGSIDGQRTAALPSSANTKAHLELAHECSHGGQEDVQGYKGQRPRQRPGRHRVNHLAAVLDVRRDPISPETGEAVVAHDIRLAVGTVSFFSSISCREARAGRGHGEACRSRDGVRLASDHNRGRGSSCFAPTALVKVRTPGRDPHVVSLSSLEQTPGNTFQKVFFPPGYQVAIRRCQALRRRRLVPACSSWVAVWVGEYTARSKGKAFYLWQDHFEQHRAIPVLSYTTAAVRASRPRGLN